ncbi:MAG TPA: hypothetical protein VF815_40530, partial [Myxococcaceae bacterium]
MSQRDNEESEALEDFDFGDSLLRQVIARPTTVVAPLPGERLGGRDGRRFELIEQLGRGGMGLVFRAQDEVLQRVVALKFIAPGLELSRSALDKLLQEEARLVAQ